MTDISHFEEAIIRLKRCNEYCIDVETSGLDFKRNHVVGYVLTFGPHPLDSYYLPFRHAGGGNLFGITGPATADGWNGWVHDAEKELIQAADRQGVLVFGHHLTFDLKMLSKVGYTMQGHYEDTSINAPLLDEWQDSFTLKRCAEIAGVAAKKSDEVVAHIKSLFPNDVDTDARSGSPRHAMAHYWRTAGDDPVPVAYARQDGTTTWQLRDWQQEQLRQQGLLRVHAIESKLLPILVRMTIRGIKIDEARLGQAIDSIDARVAELLQSFPENFNVRSSTDVRKWCEDHGNINWPLTPKKAQPSFPESWLETHEAGRAIVAVRKLTTLKNTFLIPMRDTHLFNGRVHTEYHQLRGDEFGTVTGRLSSSDPNLHAVSKRNEATGRIHRSVFIPDHGLWGNADYRQCEPRLLAFYSGCKVLVEDFRNNPDADAHASVTRAAYYSEMEDDEYKEKMQDPEFKKVFKERRETGKRVNQTLITGGGKNVIVTKYGVPREVVDEFWERYFTAMPEIKQLQKDASRVMERRGYVKSLLGRRARLVDRGKSYTAVNRLLQCGNADIIKTKMVQIDDYLASVGRPMDLINNIHDDLTFDFEEGSRSHLTECLRIMSDFSVGQPIELDIPMAVDFGEGPNWAVATYGLEKEKSKPKT